ncbi:hypothetical protein [Aliivibrio sp. A6]|uniref:hypothetical protein n=1 Tax=Aliivibrio sp. A6 TaxID=3028427 RepID=UPI002379EB0B|nr:hypothetical protein [Aliivibrio sp. A6]MDD9177454.1 hypothetical protein [Aliivibrio sp. A6]
MINFDNRLKSLKDRRQGTRERMLLASNASQYDHRDFRTQESYEKLNESSAIKYAVGAMAAVDDNSTRISIQEGERVADTLISMLSNTGIRATKEIQGSVALDIHIKGHSDVDMLILKEDIVLVETPKLNGSPYIASDQRPMTEIIRELRLLSEDKLTTRYYGTNVDCSGNKSIALSGGSLQRKVDIVPACWYHTHDYQRSGLKHDKEVQIYHKANHELVGNKPFMHIKKVNEKDSIYSGNLKKVTRLMKNLVADMPDYKKGKAKKLSSYDLTALAYDMDGQLSCPSYMSLALVERLRAHLSLLVSSEMLRDRILVPDGSRKIFNKANKLEALQIISNEVNDLAEAIYKSIVPLSHMVYDSATLNQRRVYL